MLVEEEAEGEEKESRKGNEPAQEVLLWRQGRMCSGVAGLSVALEAFEVSPNLRRDLIAQIPVLLQSLIDEPVIGQIKQARGFRQFLLPGLEKVRGEWALVCMTHNLLKFHKLCYG